MSGSIPAGPLLVASLLALGACSSVRPTIAEPSQDTAPPVTRYTFEFECPASSRFRIAGTTQWQDGHGYRSRITELRVGGRALAGRWIEQINRRLPAEAFQERPWLTCSGSGALIELRFIDREDGSVARSPRLNFIVHREGTVDFPD